MTFFIKADTLKECAEAMNILIALLRKLGFQINWKKVVDPSTRITFLGIEIAMCLRLPEDKLTQVCLELSTFLNRTWEHQSNCSPLQGSSTFAQVWYMVVEFFRTILSTQ